jgi:hypothetical protein
MNESGAGREAPAGKASRGERLREELRTYAIVAIYLWACFLALTLYKTAVLRAEGVAFLLPFGFAAVKALILGKFLLIGEMIALGSRWHPGKLLLDIPWRTLLAVVLLAALTVVEELLVGWLHGHATAQTLAEFRARSPFELATECLLLALVIAPLVTFRALNLALGPGVLRSHLHAPPPTPRR